MPGLICAVAVCKNNQLELKKRGLSIVFHSFPKGKDLVSSTIQKEWVHRCRRNDKFNINTSRVCSEHFTVNDYERDLEHELLNLPPRKILKKTAVPTVNLDQEVKTLSNTPRNERAIRKQNKEMVASLLTSHNLDCHLPSTSKHSNYHLEGPSISKPESEANLTNNYICVNEEIQDSRQISSAMQTTEPEIDFKTKYEELLQKYSSSRKKNKRLQTSLAYYKNKYYNRSINRSKS
ncbi:hypothetical protein NQ315_003962 [Exocentrus adspersus]|uniref:THAP-type domain-containing protein n=1 Tax=Exocentrus adspersus TaxID=1586481 RepID=A0AAV8V9W5_9CUCU|nr:hypothetical protein NQ315_003962 [Exocentrus adspersus]